MAKDKDLTITLKAKTAEYDKKMKDSAKETGKVGSEAEKTGEKGTKSFAKMATGIGATLVALKGLTSQMKASISASNTQEKAEKRLEIALRNSGDATKATFEAQKEFAAAIQKSTTVGDEQAMMLQAMALTMGATSENVGDVTKNAIALSKAFDIDMNTALRSSISALDENYSMLTRYIPALREANSESEKTAVYQKAVADGWKIATGELKTGYGALEDFSNTIGDLQEDLGDLIKVAILPLMQELKNFVGEISKAKDENTDLIRLFKILGNVLSNIAKVFITLIDAYALYTAKFMDFTEEILNAGKYVLDFFSGADVEAQRLLETTEKATKEAALNRAKEIGLTGQLNEQFEKLITTAGIFGNIGTAIKDNISKNIEDGIAKAKEFQNMISSVKLKQTVEDDSAEITDDIQQMKYEDEQKLYREHLEQLDEIHNEFVDIGKEAREREIDDLFEWYNVKLEMAQGNEQAEYEIKQLFLDKKEKLDKKYEKSEKTLANLRMQRDLKVAHNAIGALASLNSAMVGSATATKRLQQAMAIVDTYSAATAIMANTAKLGPIAMFASMTATILTGLANVATIEGTKFAKGGILQGNSHANGGIQLHGGGNYYGEAEGGEPILTKNVSASRPLLTIASAVNELAGGKSLITGLSVPKMAMGGVTSTIPTVNNSQLASIDNHILSMNSNIADQKQTITVVLPETNILNNTATLNTYADAGLNIEEL